MKDPSWMELNHFMKFLDFQLEACENSIYFCDENLLKEAISGLKNFVIGFMIRMSKVHTYQYLACMHACSIIYCTVYCFVHNNYDCAGFCYFIYER